MWTPGKRAHESHCARWRGGAGARLAIALGLGGILIWVFSCSPSRPVISPPPPRVASIEGYASLKLTRRAETTRAKLSFLFLIPDQGRFEILDSLGRPAALLFLMKKEAFLVLPSQRAYWAGEGKEATERLLGFDLTLEEVAAILQGKWQQLTDWEKEMDERGRVVRARRDEMRMEVVEFFDDTNLPYRLRLSLEEEKGDFRILRLRFNQPLRASTFELLFLQEDYKRCTWEEIERLMNRED